MTIIVGSLVKTIYRHQCFHRILRLGYVLLDVTNIHLSFITIVSHVNVSIKVVSLDETHNHAWVCVCQTPFC